MAGWEPGITYRVGRDTRGILFPILRGVLLAVDVGNTQTHLGAFEGSDLRESWRFQTRAGMTSDEIAERISGFMGLSGLNFRDVDAVCVSSVVPPLGNQYRKLCERYLNNGECLLIGPGIKTGMPIRIDNPYEVGADRLVNSVAAFERYDGACVVVDFGTGINFDAVSATGEYLGGAIAPGVEISLTALAQRGARIPQIDLAKPEAAIGKSTRSAIESGVMFGFAGLIDGVARRIVDELGEGTPIIATGGLASSIVPYSETIFEIDDLLTLTGLRIIWERNA